MRCGLDWIASEGFVSVVRVDLLFDLRCTTNVCCCLLATAALRVSVVFLHL